MSDQVLIAAPQARSGAAPGPGRRRPAGWLRPRAPSLRWLLVAASVLVVSLAWVVLTGMRPSYDSFGWLDWGRQTLQWNLNTDGAPSWKPLTFLFTLPYALLPRNPQMWLWMITATAGAGASSVFAARIAFRLAGPTPNRSWARWAGAVFAGAAVLGLSGLSELVLIANSDPLIATFCLAAIDQHLCGRRRLALGLVLLAAYGRPEAWVFTVLYAGYLARVDRRAWPWALAAVVSIPAAWFIVPGLTSRSWLHAGDLALGSVNAIQGNKVIGVLSRVRDQYEWPLWCGLAVAFLLALRRRERAWLGVLAAGALWVLIEIAFAYHGWSAVARYLMEPVDVFVTLVGPGVAWLLAWAPGRRPGPQADAARRSWSALVRSAPAIAALALVVALIPDARQRADETHGELHASDHARIELTRLEAVIGRLGPARIKACGQPVTLLGYQSEVAWAIGLNVGNVGYKPGVSIGRGTPIVLLKPHDNGWQVRPYHTTAACQTSMRTDSAMS